jgi:hypothetical protein
MLRILRRFRWGIERYVRFLYYRFIGNKKMVKLDYLSPVGLAPVCKGDLIQYSHEDGGVFGYSYLGNIHGKDSIGVAAEDIDIYGSGMMFEK